MADNLLTDAAIPALLGVDTAANDRYLVIDISDVSRDPAGSPKYQEHSELVASLDLIDYEPYLGDTTLTGFDGTGSGAAPTFFKPGESAWSDDGWMQVNYDSGVQLFYGWGDAVAQDTRPFGNFFAGDNFAGYGAFTNHGGLGRVQFKLSNTEAEIDVRAVSGQTTPLLDINTVLTVNADGSGLYPAWGHLTLAGAFGYPTFFTGGATFDADQSAGFYFSDRTHHGGHERGINLYSTTPDMPIGKVIYNTAAHATTLADGRAAIVGTLGYIESSDGSNYIDFEQAIDMHADGSVMEGFIYIDCAEYPSGAATRLGISAGEWMLKGRLLAGQTAPPLLIQAVGGASLFQINASGSPGFFGKTPPAQSVAGTTAADAIACLKAFGLMAP